MASLYVLLLPRRCSLILPRLMLLTDTHQQCNRAELVIPNSMTLHYVAHRTVHTLLHHFTLIEIKLQIGWPQTYLSWNTGLQSWHVLDNTLSNTDSLRCIFLSWKKTAPHKRRGYRQVSIDPCVDDVHKEILPRCSQKLKIHSVCPRMDCKRHYPP